MVGSILTATCDVETRPPYELSSLRDAAVSPKQEKSKGQICALELSSVDGGSLCWKRRDADHLHVSAEHQQIDDHGEAQRHAPISRGLNRFRPAAIAANETMEVCAANGSHAVPKRRWRFLSIDTFPARATTVRVRADPRVYLYCAF
jgi:hypothetical protein